jgi:uncharacterized membrane protein
MIGVFEVIQSGVFDATHWLRLGIEATGALWIAVGFGRATVQLASLHPHQQTASFQPIRITFTRYLSMALEFQLAADILAPAITPTWNELGQLAAKGCDSNCS